MKLSVIAVMLAILGLALPAISAEVIVAPVATVDCPADAQQKVVAVSSVERTAEAERLCRSSYGASLLTDSQETAIALSADHLTFQGVPEVARAGPVARINA